MRIRAVSPERALFTHVSGRPRENFSQRTRHATLLKGRLYTLKDWFDGKSEEHLTRDEAHSGLRAVEKVPYKNVPLGKWRLYNVASTSMQRHVASTPMQCSDAASTLPKSWLNVMTLYRRWCDVVYMSWRCIDVDVTLHIRHDITSALMRRCINAMYPLGAFVQHTEYGKVMLFFFYLFPVLSGIKDGTIATIGGTDWFVSRRDYCFLISVNFIYCERCGPPSDTGVSSRSAQIEYFFAFIWLPHRQGYSVGTTAFLWRCVPSGAAHGKTIHTGSFLSLLVASALCSRWGGYGGKTVDTQFHFCACYPHEF